ncbi:MAG TPA: VTT domain-containing protein [Bacteroidia bacterium]|jgi:membrane-associated protein|nr:VTT domain-containing protein [Bacteroidia bacterium]
MFDFLKQLTDPESIIKYGGLALLLFVIFAETGLFVGFFLPGDNLVFIAGLLCATKPEVMNVSFPVLLILMMTCAVTGNMFGFWFGKKAGETLYARKNSFFFRQSHIITTKAYYEKHGGKTLILGRFLPIIRTFAPILAGVIKIDFKKFMLYNIIGAVLWIGSIGSIAFYLGRQFPQVENYLGYIFVGLIILTALPILATYLKSKQK